MKTLILVLLVSLSGCAAVPVCERFQARGVVVEGQMYAILDAENIVKLNTMFSGLAAGTCRAE